MAKDRIIIMGVDRDDDIGRKAKLRGPIIGREKALDAATKLGLADPEESDSNSVFGCVKIFDELKGKYDSEVVVLTGHRRRGIDADREITRQLEKVLSKRPSDFVVLVSDGSDDEHVIPVIQSRIPILSVRRIIVRQAEGLESGYYKIKDFIKETLENPKFARLVFGLPAVALLLYAALGEAGWRIIVGAVGGYLFIRGFKLEDYILGAFNEFKDSFTGRKFTFFMYIVSLVIGALAVYRGYHSVLDFINIGPFESASAFLLASIYFFWLSGTIAWLGRNIRRKKRKPSRIASVPLFGFAAALVISNASELILSPDMSTFTFIVSIALGFVLTFIAVTLETVD